MDRVDTSGKEFVGPTLSEAHVRALVEFTPAMVYLKDLDGRYLYTNPAFEQRYRSGGQDVCGCTVFDLFGADEAARYAAHDRCVFDAQGVVHREQVVSGVDGGPQRVVESWKFPLIDEHGEIIALGGVEHDVTERKQAEVELAESRRMLANLLSNLPGMAYRVRFEAGECVVDFVSEGCRDLTGSEPAAVIGTRGGFLTCLVHPEDHADMAGRARECMDSGSSYQLTYRIVTLDGTVKWVWEQGRGVFDESGELLCVEGFVSDVTEARVLSDRLSYQASHDALTELLNRRAFEERLDRLLASTAERGGTHALCYIDLDQFKVVNDTCGHVAGDELMRQIARTLSVRVRKHDALARLGGDEFGVLMEDCDVAQAERVAEVLRRAVQDFRFVWGDNSFTLGASIGLVPIGLHSGDATDAFRAADAACYAAKEGGRNRVHVYHAEDGDLMRRHGEMQWVARINSALDEGRLRLYFQHIRALQTPDDGRLHFEILLRMLGREGELVPPGAFLPAAERYGVVTRLDRWVVGETLGWLAAHPGVLERVDHCAINLSGHSLGDADFLAFLIESLERSRVPAERICLEVTETAAIANLAGATRFMQTLRARGVRFALDDFGSGVSSFAYLKTLPVDFLKIDGLFVKDILDDPIDLALVRSINDIGHVMGKRTIAEFVENEAVLAALREVGVDFGQGYGIARPAPLASLGDSPQAACAAATESGGAARHPHRLP